MLIKQYILNIIVIFLLSILLGYLEFNIISFFVNENLSLNMIFLDLGLLIVLAAILNLIAIFYSSITISSAMTNYMENRLSNIQKNYNSKDLSAHTDSLTKKFTDGANRAIDGFLIPIAILPSKITAILAILYAYGSIAFDRQLVVFITILLIFIGITIFSSSYYSKKIGKKIHDSISGRVIALHDNTLGFRDYFFANMHEEILKRFSKQLDFYRKARPLSEILIHMPKISIDFWLGIILIFVYFYSASSYQINFDTVTIVALIRVIPYVQHIFSTLNQVLSNYDAVMHFFSDEEVDDSFPLKHLKLKIEDDSLVFTSNNGTEYKFYKGPNLIFGKSGSGKTTLMTEMHNVCKKNELSSTLLFSDPYFNFYEDFKHPIDDGVLEIILNNTKLIKRMKALKDNRAENTNFSLGESQRLNFIRFCGSANGDILFLDESFSGVHSDLEESIIDYLLHKYDYVIIVTHRKLIRDFSNVIEIKNL